MRTCEDCGSRVYNLGCVNCNEEAYIAEQERLTNLDIQEAEAIKRAQARHNPRCASNWGDRCNCGA